MESVSVVVPAHNNAAVLGRTLASVEEALAFFRRQGPRYQDVAAEVVVVDDGSRDGTWEAARRAAEGKPFYKLLRRPCPGGAGCARNAGAAAGDLLFFLDGDDLFLPEHIHVCYRALEAGGPDFVKTCMRLADPIHPDWKRAVENSSVINLCLRRRCHLAFGGFPDYHVFAREGHGFRPVLNVYHKTCEDIFYKRLLRAFCTGCRVERDTVEYMRYPGNGYDRQYEKFQKPYGAHQEAVSEEEGLRLRLADALFQYHLHELNKARKAKAA
jgi:glycosyltransferase involved in cell wall biosynthesis